MTLLISKNNPKNSFENRSSNAEKPPLSWPKTAWLTSKDRKVWLRMLAALLLCLALIVLYLTWNHQANWQFTVRFRSSKLMVLVLVAIAIAWSTVLFQTLTHNRILTPAIMGFDSLYILLQTLLVFSFGRLFYSQIDPVTKWLIEASIMLLVMGYLFNWIFKRQAHNLPLLILVGVMLGFFFSSVSQLLNRMIDPAEFEIVQDAMFAQFSKVADSLLLISAVVLAVCAGCIWWWRAALDVMLLGQHQATNLGLDYHKLVQRLIIVIALLVSVSTALVGPITFFGLLVANLAYRLAGNFKHQFVLPMAALIAIAMLVGGEFIVQHVFQFETRLSMVLEFIGGIFFLVLLLRQGKKGA